MSQNGADNKLLLFGSFTEDELKSLQSPSPRKAVERKTLEKKDLQFGTVDFATVKSLSDLNVRPGQVDSLEGSKSIQPSEVDKKGKELKNAAAQNDVLHVASEGVKENGSTHTSLDFLSLNKEGREHEGTIVNSASPVYKTKASPPELLVSSKPNGLESGRSIDNNVPTINHSLPSEIAANSSGVIDCKEDKQKALNGLAGAVKNLLPRGLINSGNLCFLNSTLQALLSCSPFVQLLQELRIRNIPKIGYPTLYAFVEFISDFEMPADSSLKKNEMANLLTGRPFKPAMFESILKHFTPDVPNSISGRPSQEDAQEFLSFVMDQMHDELLKLQGQLSKGGSNVSLLSSSEDDGWEIVGPKNKSAVTRTQSFVPSELSAIFGGQLRSVVKARGNKASATVQPFLLLHLDIFPDAVCTIEDALRLFSAPETLEGYRASAAGKAGVVSASKSVKIQTLSKVMILHLMRFGYGSQGSTKLHKSVWFPLELTLGRELLVSPSTESRKYELVATVTHHGREPSKGHYTADCFHADGQWLRYDDASVTAVGVNKVLHDQAYVLFYRQA
ncbi:hypothetical protein IFM89_031913 [Coptis chinensis]|uniref:Ubiquitin carboxyl-terminal hydrolase n=1 Tax=Coptis chinensis TaxID=261450 RepID=A0A835MCY6_9MAGN|nr:hypothetical protein IFM89_031913 [Coptis chinensis]